MATHRIGRFERWILLCAYLKNVKLKLPLGWRFPRKVWENLEKRGDECYFEMLSKSDVLLNYFNLESSYKEPWFEREKFKDTKEHRSALASYSRTMRAMEKKGYVEFWSHAGRDETGLTLTDIGKRIAERLNVNSSM